MKSKLKKLFHNDHFISLFTTIFSSAISLGSLMLLVRTFDKDAFGEWVLFLTGATFIEMLRNGLTNTALVRFLSGLNNNKEKKELIGASWQINSVLSISISILLIIAYFSFQSRIEESGFSLFFKYYPIKCLVDLPSSMSIFLFQAERKFMLILYRRLANFGLFFLIVLANFLFLDLNVEVLVILYITVFFINSLYLVITGLSGIQNLKFGNTDSRKKLLNFGKFSIGTLIGANLLKSSDTFLIGLMMTQADVALYAIPLKAIDLIELPIRSLVNVSIPKISSASKSGNIGEVRRLFNEYAGILTISFIPLILILFFSAPQIIFILGGEQYLQASSIFKILLIYTLFIPLSKFSGITLDCINKPKLNFKKVLITLIVNIIGDIIAIYMFNSLHLIALATSVNVLISLVLSYFYIKKNTGINIFLSPLYGLKHLSNFKLGKMYIR